MKRFHTSGQRTVQPFDMATLALKGKAHALSTPKDIVQAFAAWSNADGEWTLGLFRRRCCEAMVYGGAQVDPSFAKVEAFND